MMPLDDCAASYSFLLFLLFHNQINMEVNFPPVPNVEEVRFGTPLNQRFGKTTVGQDLQVVGGYKPGSELSRDLIAYSNVYWAKKLASSFGGKPVGLLTAERVNFSLCKNIGAISRTGFVLSDQARKAGRNGEARSREVWGILPVAGPGPPSWYWSTPYRCLPQPPMQS